MEKERQLTEEEVTRLEREYDEQNAPGTRTTRALEGAPTKDVEDGVREVQEAERALAEEAGVPGLTSPSALGATVQPAEQTRA